MAKEPKILTSNDFISRLFLNDSVIKSAAVRRLKLKKGDIVNVLDANNLKQQVATLRVTAINLDDSAIASKNMMFDFYKNPPKKATRDNQ